MQKSLLFAWILYTLCLRRFRVLVLKGQVQHLSVIMSVAYVQLSQVFYTLFYQQLVYLEVTHY